jgi:hypothetical protein
MNPSLTTVRHQASMRHLLGGLAIALFCSACAQLGKGDSDKAAPPENRPVATEATLGPSVDKARQELNNGIASYENGAYKTAARQLQSALALGLADGASQARAHKYLAFMHCVGGRQRQCREEFGKAFAADPSFDLSPAEAGHPTWGPVFRKLKAARTTPAK